jgi:hypothetical protein
MKWGGDLISIHNNAENNLVRRLIGSNDNKAYWIGMHDIRKESKYQWMDNTRTNYFSWDKKKQQPGRESPVVDCTSSQDKHGNWHDLACTKKLPFVCRKHHGRTFKPLFFEVESKGRKVIRDNGLFNLLDIDIND